ncbi:MAG TPA: hypothetical protein VKZ86_13555 [Cyclobacteriaceae bacterium]|nr:hypothetical protein [Cyclobacteriaceae bacterium]
MIGRAFFWLLMVGIVSACGNKKIHLDGIDLQTWISDPGGCEGLRITAMEPLERQREKLLRLDEREITQLLGKPDENELYVRGQKFYRYYLEPSRVCDNGTGNARSLVIRFNAVGLSSEVYLE